MNPGIHTLTGDQYHADQIDDQPTLSASIATVLCNQSPAHARAAHPKLNPAYQRPEKKSEWDIGTIAHALLLEGYDIAHVVEGYDNWRTKAAQAEAADARATGKIPMLRKEWEEVAAMVDAARDQLAAYDAVPPLLTDGKPEQTLVWTIDDVVCRARLDWLRDDFAAIDDYKTARSAAQASFTRNAIYDHGYEIKACFYLRAVKALTGVDASFRWIVQEKKPPYVLSVIEPGADVLAMGNAKVDKAVALWKRCLASGEWPGYGTRVATAELPPWIESQWLERELRDEVAA